MSRVALIGENSIEYISLLLDIWNSGDCAALLDWKIPIDTAVEMMSEANIQVCYIERKFFDKISSNYSDIKFIVYDKQKNQTECLTKEIANKYFVRDDSSEAVIIYSSGTTGKSKGIILSHHAINSNADAIIDYMDITKDDCMYIAKPFSHSSTLTGELLVALKCGIKLVVAPTIVPPRYILNKIHEYNVTIICLNPMLLSMCAKEYGKGKYSLSSLKTIYVSGSILNDKEYNLAHKAFEKINIYNVYGLSEAGPRVSAQCAGYNKTNSVGKPIKGVQIILLDDNGNRVGINEYGIIHIKTPSLFNGYVTGKEKNRSLLDGWFNTGDIGFFDDNNELHILGRTDDVVIINSHKIYPTDVEKLILKCVDVNECIVCKSSDEQLVCLYVSQNELKTADVKSLYSVLMAYEIPNKYIKVDSLPRTFNGKIIRKY